MKFSIDKHEKYVVITLNESCFSNEITPKIKSEFILLNAEGYCNIILDLSKVKGCKDSQDLSSLLIGDRLCKKSNGLFVITGLHPEITKMIQISGLHQSLSIVSKLSEATDLIFMVEIEKELLGSYNQRN